MKVFISWSGERSKAVAELLDEWISCVIQFIRPWLSSKDIDRGALWFSELSDQLKEINLGIVCLTKENLNAPWILFEAGALAKGLSSSRVCTLLIDLEPGDVGNPLAQFNHSKPEKDSIFNLVRTLNSSLNEQALKDDVLKQVFETYWPQFEKKFTDILKDIPIGEDPPTRTNEDILSEVLSTVRSLNRRVRSIEGSEKIVARSKYMDDGWPPSNIAAFIRSRLAMGMPAEEVRDLLRGKGTTSFIEKVIRDYMHKPEDDIPSWIFETTDDSEIE